MPEETLIVAVLRFGLSVDGLDYLAFECGTYWLELLGLEVGAAWLTATKGTDHAIFGFRSLPCRHSDVVVAGPNRRIVRLPDWHEGFTTREGFDEFYARAVAGVH